MWVPTKALLELVAAALKQHTVSGNYSGPLYGAYLGLCIAPTPSFTQNSLMGGLTEATFTGYARAAITWGTTYQTPQALQVLPSGLVVFQPSDAVSPNVITGVFLADAITTGNLLAGYLFTGGGYPLPDANSALPLVALFGSDYGGEWGSAVISA